MAASAKKGITHARAVLLDCVRFARCAAGTAAESGTNESFSSGTTAIVHGEPARRKSDVRRETTCGTETVCVVSAEP